MCVLCYEFDSDQHWADAVADGAVRSRYRRVRILQRVLAPYGVQVAYPGTGQHLMLSNAKGVSDVASTLPEVWDRAAALAGRNIDILDEAVLEQLKAARERAR